MRVARNLKNEIAVADRSPIRRREGGNKRLTRAIQEPHAERVTSVPTTVAGMEFAMAPINVIAIPISDDARPRSRRDRIAAITRRVEARR